MTIDSPRKVSFSRNNTTKPIIIYFGGKRIGRIEASLTTHKKFIVTLNQVYYSGSGLIRCNGGGCQGKWLKTLHEARLYVINITKILEIRPYDKNVL